MNRILIVAATLAALATPSLATEGLPGATVRTDGGKAAAERRARFEQWCKENPEQCREAKAKAQQRREECKANPEKCRAEAQAQQEERFKRADANKDGRLTRGEAQKGMPVVARNFDQIDANKDGAVTMEEIAAARKSRAGAGKGKGN
jgi:ferric-dicitrate binding protein FerR (iron transport regulator)